MEFGTKLSLLLLLSVCSVSCFPSRPLNDRPSELAWQAWLLVDSQNQLQNESDRRITPKSVFIAPKLGQRNDSLPDCAEGYKADPMGRCIKSVKVDEAAHLNFLLQRLNSMYAEQEADYEESEAESEESAPTTGPLQVNIPLGQSEEVESSPDIAVVVAPTNGQFDDKVNVKRHPPVKEPESGKHNVEQVELPPISDDEYEESSTEELDTTTQTEENTETTYTSEVPTTEESTEDITEEMTEFTTLLSNVADDGLKALFFLTPPNSTTIKQNITNSTTPHTLEKYEKRKDVISEFASAEPEHIVEDISSFIRSAERHQPNNLKFPDEKTVKFSHIIGPSQDQRTDFVVDNERGYYRNGEHHKPHDSELTPSQIQELFRQYIQRPIGNMERVQIPHERVFNHRNRDRHEDLWNLRPSVPEENSEKPLVLRFGRYPSAYYPQNIYNPKHVAHEVQYYGEDTGQSQEYSNVYGRKRKRGSLR